MKPDLFTFNQNEENVLQNDFIVLNMNVTNNEWRMEKAIIYMEILTENVIQKTFYTYNYMKIEFVCKLKLNQILVSFSICL